MPVNVKPLFDKIMKDPDVIPEDGQEKKDLAMAMVLQRATQSINNERALSMANSDNSVSKLLDFVALSKAEDSKWGKGAAEWLRDERGYTAEAIEDMRIKATAGQTKGGKRSTTLTLKEAQNLGSEFASGDDKIDGWEPPTTGDADENEDEDEVQEETEEERGTRFLENQGFTGAEIDDFSDDQKQLIFSEIAKDPTITTAQLKEKLENPDESSVDATVNLSQAEVARIEEDLKSGASTENIDEFTDPDGKGSEKLTDNVLEVADASLNQTAGTGGKGTSGADTREEERSDEFSVPRGVGGAGQGLGDVGVGGKAKKARDVPASSLPKNMGGDEKTSFRVNEHLQRAAEATAKAEGNDTPEGIDKAYDNLQVALQRLLGPIAEQYARNEDFRTGTTPRRANYKMIRENGWGKWFLAGFTPKEEGGSTPTNAEFYDQLDKWAEQLAKETEEIDPPGGTKSKPTTNVARTLKTKNQSTARKSMEKIWSPENTAHLAPKTVKSNVQEAQQDPEVVSPITENTGGDEKGTSDTGDDSIKWTGGSKYNHDLKNGQIIRDSNDKLYSVDRLNGYMVELMGINEDGSWRSAGHRTINTDPSSPEFDKNTSYFPHKIGEGDTAIDNHKDLVAAKAGTQQRMDTDVQPKNTSEKKNEQTDNKGDDSKGKESDTTGSGGGTDPQPQIGTAGTAGDPQGTLFGGDDTEDNTEQTDKNEGGTTGDGDTPPPTRTITDEVRQHLLDVTGLSDEDIDAGIERGDYHTKKGNPKKIGKIRADFPAPTTEDKQESDKDTTEGAKDTTEGGDQEQDDKEAEKAEQQKQISELIDKAKDLGVLEHIYEGKYGKDNPFVSFEDFEEKFRADALAKPNVEKLTGQLSTGAKKLKDATNADTKAVNAKKAADRKTNANDVASLVDDLPFGTDRATATNKLREILEHKEKYGEDISAASRKKMGDAAEKLIQNHKADPDRAHKLVQQHKDAGGFDDDASDDLKQRHQDNIDQQTGEIETEDAFEEHVSGESGREARRNSYENNDSDRLVHTDKNGNVTHTTLMHSNYLGGKKKVKEDADQRSVAHNNDQYEVHGDDDNIKGSRSSQSHHDWDSSKRGQHGEEGKQQLAAYKAEEAKLSAAQKAGNSEEEAAAAKAMEELDKESGGALSGIMSETEKNRLRIARGDPPPPGIPPFEGGVWSPEVHQWVSREKLSEIQGGLGDGDGFHVTPDDFSALLGHHETDSSAAHADGTFGHGGNGSVHVTKYGIHKVANLPNPNEGTPTNMPQHLGAKGDRDSTPHLAAQSLASDLRNAGIMSLNPDGSTNHGTSGKIDSHYKDEDGNKTSERVLRNGADLHSRSNHGTGQDVDAPISSQYVKDLKEAKAKERIPNAKKKFETAIGRFRAIRDNPSKAARAARHKLGQGARKAGRRVHGALRRFDDTMRGEFKDQGILGSAKVMGQHIGREAKYLGGAMPIVGPEAKARRAIGAGITGAKKNLREEQARMKWREKQKRSSAVQQLKERTNPSKTTEESTTE